MANPPLVKVEELFPDLKFFQDPTFSKAVIQVWELAMARGNFTHPERCNFLPRELLRTQISLVTHTRTVTAIALSSADILAKTLPIKRDHLLAGALLHDAGKLIEYAPVGEETTISQGGKRLNHRFSGASLCQEVGLPREIVHIVYAHSEEGRFVVRSVEAVIVFHADFTHFEAVKANFQE
jgi:putative nucleotidyltransferase with HDIG domain